jgi:hypothetical protein
MYAKWHDLFDGRSTNTGDSSLFNTTSCRECSKLSSDIDTIIHKKYLSFDQQQARGVSFIEYVTRNNLSS